MLIKICMIFEVGVGVDYQFAPTLKWAIGLFIIYRQIYLYIYIYNRQI